MACGSGWRTGNRFGGKQGGCPVDRRLFQLARQIRFFDRVLSRRKQLHRYWYNGSSAGIPNRDASEPFSGVNRSPVKGPGRQCRSRPVSLRFSVGAKLGTGGSSFRSSKGCSELRSFCRVRITATQHLPPMTSSGLRYSFSATSLKSFDVPASIASSSCLLLSSLLHSSLVLLL